ncbi:cof family hydrolase [Listeria floridensis FSL S10-1187]|uniref:Cof family hydrolase n=1 Tax=Listeria floridensis FSL S10-1187 TaxID=1265817 RepID=A0ABP3AXC6_9LIST|nr:Cof-type HAD-IIB family hydrolase [Listeria floridensis]EUJ28841.1 cof family hydrolase [Listeria floridensis FSL S10-1187]
MIKLVAIDLDGTLLNDQHEVTPGVIEAVGEARERGMKIVLCTGRPLAGIKTSLDALDLFHADDVAITMNGAITLETNSEQIVSSTALGKADLARIFDFCSPLGAHVTYFDAVKMYIPHREISILTARDSLLLETPLYYQTVDEAEDTIEIPKVMLLDEPEKITEVIDALTDELKARYTIVRSVPYNLEFLHPDVSKGHALRALAQKLGITAEEVMCLGDAENDVSMFEFAGLPIAMENATEKIKNLAKKITKSNNEDGVAYALRNFA